MTDAALSRAAALVRDAGRIVALTGAGISTESGIPDFRGPSGSWTRYDPEVFAYPRYVSDAGARRRYWAWSREFWGQVADARPNGAHLALARLEAAGRLRCVVTQNVDGLHHAAGSREVVEVHGNGTRVKCLDCGDRTPRADVQPRLEAGEDDPRCLRCGGVLKTCAVLFGEAMPLAEITRAFDEAGACDLLLVVGSSLLVHPAARVVPIAAAAGAPVVIVNLEPTPYDDLAAAVVRSPAAAALAALAGPPDETRGSGDPSRTVPR